MKHNYHTHTFRCHHASGTEREYIETGLANGLTTLGFSDHAPYCFPGSYYSNFRVDLDMTTDYFETLGKLREEYRETHPELTILLGFEMEYYPELFERTLDFIDKHAAVLPSGEKAGLEYLILGQHMTKNEYDGGIPAGRPDDDEEKLRDYVSQVIAAMETGCYTYVAHPDMVNFEGKESIFEKAALELCTAAKELNVPLEINLLGLHEHRHYPRDLFWDVASSVGCKAVLGCDAHAAERVGNPVLVAEGEAFAKAHGLVLLEEVEIRNPLK